MPGDSGRKIDGIVAHRTRLDRRDIWFREGILITSPARTALDVAPMLSHERVRRMLRQAQAEGRVRVAQLADALSRAPRHRGARAIRAVIADGPAPTRSGAEDILLDLIAEAGLPAPEVNPPLAIDGTALMRTCSGATASSSSSSTASGSTRRDRPP